MFAVPKDTQLLIFTIPFSGGIDVAQIKSLEHQLSEITGIPCVIFDGYVDPEDEEYGDFEIRWQEDPPSPEPPEKEVQQTDIVFAEETCDKRDNCDDGLDQRQLRLLRRQRILQIGLLALNLIAPFFLGLLAAYFLEL